MYVTQNCIICLFLLSLKSPANITNSESPVHTDVTVIMRCQCRQCHGSRQISLLHTTKLASVTFFLQSVVYIPPTVKHDLSKIANLCINGLLISFLLRTNDHISSCRINKLKQISATTTHSSYSCHKETNVANTWSMRYLNPKTHK